MICRKVHFHMAESFDNVRISKFQNPFAGDKMMFDDGAAALSFSIKKRAWLHGKFFIVSNMYSKMPNKRGVQITM